MCGFEEFNPLAAALYFAAVCGITMFCMNPGLLIVSLIGALSLFFIRNGSTHTKVHIFALLMFCAAALVNPIFSHNGVTVLFIMNNNPVTAEAFIYGVCAAGMITASFYWFYSFTQIMTSDKLLYIFGFFSPKIALILSMAIRFVPMFSRQHKRVKDAQRALGLYSDDNIIDSLKGNIRVFSVMVTWALENGIITADSMAARGYGCGKRSRFATFSLKKRDIAFICVTVLLFLQTLIGTRGISFICYPAVSLSSAGVFGKIGYISYTALVLLPTFIDIAEAVRWKYLISKI